VAGRGRVRTTAEAISELALGWTGVPVAIENGAHSGWISRTLEATGRQACVANPSRWRGTAHASKNDANDAERWLGWFGWIRSCFYPITHPTRQQQEDLSGSGFEHNS
jgi:hypothetical protein